MKFLADQDVWASTVAVLRRLGHDVAAAGELGLGQSSDVELLQVARKQGRILVSRDRDFGGLIFVEGLGAGVIYLRISPSTQHATHAALERALNQHREDELQASFVVIEPGRYRIRRLDPDLRS